MEEAKKQGSAESAEAVENHLEKKPHGYFWFVAQGTLLKGPYSTSELKKLIAKKEISEKFFAWRDGYHEWRPLYGIDEFKLGVQEDLSYPSVPVPGTATHPSKQSQAEVSRQQKVPIYKVRFNRSRWSDLKKTEVVFLFLASLAFTMAILMLSLNVFEKQWESVWGKRTSGMLYSLGKVPEALPSYLYEPVLTAPGLENQETHFVPVEIESDMDRFNTEHFRGRKIESHLAPEALETLAWDKSNTYIRRMRVQGYIDLKDPKALIVEVPGLPFEPVLSERIPKSLFE
ncbi:MAG: DUF4339 domain-containing protein [Bdellovibrionota bacterium]